MVPGVILEKAVISEAIVRGDEFLSINRIWPSYSPRPIPVIPLTFTCELPMPCSLFLVMCVRSGLRGAARPRLGQGDPEWLPVSQHCKGPPMPPAEQSVGAREETETLAKLLVTMEIQSGRERAVVLVVMGLNKITSSYYSHQQAALHHKAYRSQEVPILFPLKFHEKRLVFLAKQDGNRTGAVS